MQFLPVIFLMTDFNRKKIYAKIYFYIDKFVYGLRIIWGVRAVSFVKGKIYHLFLINVILKNFDI